MDSRNKHLETLSEIRSLMERSSKFISLSGLSGIAAGVIALLGAALVFLYLGKRPFDGELNTSLRNALSSGEKWGLAPMEFFVLVATSVLVTAIGAGIYFTTRKAARKGQKIWDSLTKRLLISLAIPLVTGGLFCIVLIRGGNVHLVAATMLIFYGLALVNASNLTLRDIFYLGISEIILGLIALNFVGLSLEFWAIGFGLLHILYGTLMYYKYDLETT